MERRGDGNLDAELVRAMRLALADAFDLGGVQRIDLRPPLVLALLAHPARQHQGEAKDLLERLSPLILRTMSRVTRPRWVRRVRSARLARLNCLAWA